MSDFTESGQEAAKDSTSEESPKIVEETTKNGTNEHSETEKINMFDFTESGQDAAKDSTSEESPKIVEETTKNGTNGHSATASPHKEEEEEPQTSSVACNPAISDNEDGDEQLERIRGDAIGDTLYSERFVLSTLMRLTAVKKELAEDEDFEQDLCALWDMTIEEAVVSLLLEHNVFDLFTQCIEATEDKRLIEILVGMLGNMCCVEEAREQLCHRADVMHSLLALTDCGDALTLVQLMRLWTVSLMNTDATVTAERWFRHFRDASPNFVQQVAFILNSSTNETLLRQTLEALNAILAKFAVIEPPPSDEEEKKQKEDQAPSEEQSEQEIELEIKQFSRNGHPVYFSDVFVNAALIGSTTEAFNTLAARWCAASDDTDNEIDMPTQSTRKVMETFLNIHSILTQYGENIKPNYAPHLGGVLGCMNIILAPLCEPSGLLPLSSYEYNVLENISDVFLALNDPFSVDCFCKLITIWQLVAYEVEELKEKEKTKTTTDDLDDNDFEESDIDPEHVLQMLLDFLSRIIVHGTEAQLRQALCQHTTQVVHHLLTALDANSGSAVKTKIKRYCETLSDSSEDACSSSKIAKNPQ